MVKRNNSGGEPGKSRGVRRNRDGIADWESADANLLRHAIERAAFTGGALRFGYSRDGGAYAVGVYGDGEPYTEFVRPSEDLDAFLQDCIDLFDGIADEQAQARNRRKTQNQPPQGDLDGQ